MRNLFNLGRIFYGTAIAETGLQTIYYHDFPYWLIPPKHSSIPGIVMLAYVSGILLFLAGACIIFEKKPRTVSLLLGGVLLLIFCLCYVPYEFIAGSNYLSLAEWENAEKEVVFAGGAFVIAGCYSEENENNIIRLLGKLIPFGAIIFSIPMISFGILHFLYAKDVSDYVPSWVPNPLFWTYLCGAALIGSGIAIILKIKLRLIATLLGAMIFTWFIVLHIPRVIVSPAAYVGSEVTSAMLALGYSGIAFVIADRNKIIR